MTALELLSHYKDVLNEEHGHENDRIAIITNTQAVEDGIMLVGMNPSGTDGEELFNYPECHDKWFWNPKHNMMGDYDSKCAYIDLLPLRDGNQKLYCNSGMCRFLGKLLSHTRDYIEDMCPRLIISANRMARYYWGFDKDNPWMGYRFSAPIPTPLGREKQCWKLYKFIGITETGVNRNAKASKLTDKSYFLQYRQHYDRCHRPVGPDKELTFEDIRTIAKFIDSNWEKELH